MFHFLRGNHRFILRFLSFHCTNAVRVSTRFKILIDMYAANFLLRTKEIVPNAGVADAGDKSYEVERRYWLIVEGTQNVV